MVVAHGAETRTARFLRTSSSDGVLFLLGAPIQKHTRIWLGLKGGHRAVANFAQLAWHGDAQQRTGNALEKERRPIGLGNPAAG